MSNVLIYECLRPGFHNTQRNARTHATQRSCVKTLRTQRNATHARPVLAYNITQRNVRKVPNWPNATQRKRWTHVLILRRKRNVWPITSLLTFVTWRCLHHHGDSSLLETVMLSCGLPVLHSDVWNRVIAVGVSVCQSVCPSVTVWFNF